MPAPIQPKPANGMRHGPVHQVPCPHCGKTADLSDIAEHIDASRPRDSGEIECDHCHQHYEVVQVRSVTVFAVRQCKPKPGTAVQAVQPRPVPQGVLSRFLGKR